ncbi:unnamed protein product [Ectocarpus sp. CCAP 1310/34]|nr:unnamed protein product [Ectocarpus sp. CCAP 1310/34]
MAPCETCKIQKSTLPKRNTLTKTAQHTAVQPCQRVYTDLLGPISPPAKGGYNYVSKFTDEYSRMNIVYLIRSKDEAINTLDRFIQDIVIPNGFRLERLRNDNGGEYSSEYYRDFCKTIGIVQEFTVPATPQQNGIISERAGRTLMNIVRCLMHGGKLPEFLWGELCCTTVHITNRLPHVHLNNETPYYRMFGKQASLRHLRQASLRHLRVIGSTASVHLETYKSKLVNRAWPGILIGYSPDSRAYRVFNPHTKRIVHSRNVTFIEPMDAAMPPAIPTPAELRNDTENELLSSVSSDVNKNKNKTKTKTKNTNKNKTKTKTKNKNKNKNKNNVSVATQVAISRRVQRYKLALRGRQDAENRRTRSTSDQSTPMIWGWSVDAS